VCALTQLGLHINMHSVCKFAQISAPAKNIKAAVASPSGRSYCLKQWPRDEFKKLLQTNFKAAQRLCDIFMFNCKTLRAEPGIQISALFHPSIQSSLIQSEMVLKRRVETIFSRTAGQRSTWFQGESCGCESPQETGNSILSEDRFPGYSRSLGEHQSCGPGWRLPAAEAFL